MIIRFPGVEIGVSSDAQPATATGNDHAGFDHGESVR
jgi:hypothetical protein